MQLSALRPTYVKPRASMKKRLTGFKVGSARQLRRGSKLSRPWCIPSHMGSMGVSGAESGCWCGPVVDWYCGREVGVAMNLRQWIPVYLATGPSFTRWAVLAFYGGGLVVVVLVVLTALALIGGKVKEIFG